MGEKVQLNVRIDRKLYDRLWKYLKSVYSGSLYGVLSLEVQNAIAHWLSEKELVARTNTHINPGLPRAQQKIDQIIKWLRDHGFINQFTTRDWEKACLNTVGGDPRTVRKYLNLAALMGRIKFHVANTWEII